MTENNDQNLERIDQALAGLVRDDAPEHVVQNTLTSVRDAQTAEPAANHSRDRNWTTGLAAAVVAFAALGIVYQQLPEYRDVMSSPEPEVLRNVDAHYAGGKDGSEDETETARFFRSAESLRKSAAETETAAAPAGALALELVEYERLAVEGDGLIDNKEQLLLDQVNEVRAAGGHREAATLPAAVPATPTFDANGRSYAPAQSKTKPGFGDRYRGNQDNEPGKSVGGFASISEVVVEAKPNNRGSGFGGYKDESKGQSAAGDDLSKLSSDLGWVLNGSEPQAEADPADKRADFDGLLLRGAAIALPASDAQVAEHFLASYRNVDGLSYQQATGYWANSYVPGDPAMRRLEAQLRSQHPQALASTLERNAQPFDAPHTAALGVFLHATQTAVDGPARVQLQVGLKAAERQGGLRPPMNVAVVLDLPETVDVAVAQQVRALLMAMNQQRQTGDRFSVTVAGVPGGTVVRPDDYRHGTVMSFIERLANGQLEGVTLDLVDAFVAAVDRLAADDDPNAVLGSSLVMLVSAQGIDASTRDGIEILAHSSAVAGMPVSAVTLAGIDGADLDAIILAGQGRLRALVTPADATQLVDRELHSASRTVARAVRLRIQLNPSVRLVAVLGSYRLDDLSAQRVREAEQSIDARLSRTWGIEADRGDDEEGIQIVIPGIAAGENHVVLLDVVVDGPGAVADVQVRYKDLVQMRNGVARASLSLADASNSRRAQGPLERNVLKNLLALKVADAARRSARGLADGDPRTAYIELTNALNLITGLRHRVAGWQSDAELLADEQRLTRFLSELGAGSTDRLVAELEYAAYRKLLPAQLNEDERR